MLKSKIQAMVAKSGINRDTKFEIIHDANAAEIIGGDGCPNLTDCGTFTGDCGLLAKCGTYKENS